MDPSIHISLSLSLDLSLADIFFFEIISSVTIYTFDTESARIFSTVLEYVAQQWRKQLWNCNLFAMFKEVGACVPLYSCIECVWLVIDLQKDDKLRSVRVCGVWKIW